MDPAPPPCANCAAPAKHNCARCKAAPYCGAPCQRAHWRAHKPLCVAPSEAAGGAPPSLPPVPAVPTSFIPPVVDPHCGHCAKALPPDNKGLCNACKSVAFCDAACQRAAWQAHKPACLARAKARVRTGEGELGGSEEVLAYELAQTREQLGDEHPHTLNLIDRFATLLQRLGRLSEAEPLFREALVGRRRALGDAHPDTLGSINNLALLL